MCEDEENKLDVLHVINRAETASKEATELVGHGHKEHDDNSQLHEHQQKQSSPNQ